MVELVWSGSGAAAARSGSRHCRHRDEIAGNKGWRPSGHRFRGRNRLYVHPKDSVSTILGRCVPAPARQLLSNAAQQQALPWKKSVARHETPDPVPKRVIFPPLRGFLDRTGAAMPPSGELASQTKLSARSGNRAASCSARPAKKYLRAIAARQLELFVQSPGLGAGRRRRRASSTPRPTPLPTPWSTPSSTGLVVTTSSPQIVAVGRTSKNPKKRRAYPGP